MLGLLNKSNLIVKPSCNSIKSLIVGSFEDPILSIIFDVKSTNPSDFILASLFTGIEKWESDIRKSFKD